MGTNLKLSLPGEARGHFPETEMWQDQRSFQAVCGQAGGMAWAQAWRSESRWHV